MNNTQKVLSNRVADTIKKADPQQSRRELVSSGKYLTGLEIKRHLGSKIFGFGLKNIKVWTDAKDISAQIPDFQGANFGKMDPKALTQTDRGLMGVFGLELNDKNCIVFTENSVAAFKEAYAPYARKYVELDDSNVHIHGQDMVVIGYGDAYGNGAYGAGPTRNPLRATFAARIFAVLENVQLQTSFLGFKTGSELTENIGRNIDIMGKYRQSEGIGGSYNISPILSVEGENIPYLDLHLANLSRERIGHFTSAINGDIVVSLTFGAITGHAFLPAEIRGASPLYGTIESMLGKGYGDVLSQVASWADEQFGKLRVVLQKIIPQNVKVQKSEAITVDNT